MQTHKTIDAYIDTFPHEVQETLERLRKTIQRAAPKATEAIKYGIPTFVQDGNLVHFGAFEKHIGFYPGLGGIHSFKKELAKYGGSKGTVKFPINEPLPYDLIATITGFRVEENAMIKKRRRADKGMR